MCSEADQEGKEEGGPVTAPLRLTQNQKKKLRQKRARWGKAAKAGQGTGIAAKAAVQRSGAAASQQTADSEVSSLWAMRADAHGPQQQGAAPLEADLPAALRLRHALAQASGGSAASDPQHPQTDAKPASRRAAQPAASEGSQLSCSHSPAAAGRDEPAEPLSPPAPHMQWTPRKRSRSEAEQGTDGRPGRPSSQLSRRDMSRAAAVIAASLPTASTSSSEQAAAAAAPREKEEGGDRGSGSRRRPPRSPSAAVHGNYHRYYGYRLGQAIDADPRLQVLHKHWFQNRRVLDIGCNEGIVTLALAARFGTAAITGVDIDAYLIHEASRQLRERRAQATAYLAAVSHRRGAPAPSPGVSPSQQRKAAAALAAALRGVRFLHADFLDVGGAGGLEPGSFDTVVCLSVTKWVHLNAGDEGLQALFARVWRLLAPGGHFLLEPQPWRSYLAAVRKQARAGRGRGGGGACCEPDQGDARGGLKEQLAGLAMRPEGFVSYLTDVLGFAFVRQLRRPSGGKGFDRPLFLLRKPFPPSDAEVAVA